MVDLGEPESRRSQYQILERFADQQLLLDDVLLRRQRPSFEDYLHQFLLHRAGRSPTLVTVQ